MLSQFGFDIALSGDGYVRSLRAMGMVIIDHNKQDIGSCRFQEMLKNAGIVPDVLIQKNDEEQKYQVVATHPMEVHHREERKKRSPLQHPMFCKITKW